MITSTLEAAALDYANRGWRVFPCQPQGKTPMPGLKWKDEATTDPERVREWWASWPDANVGLVTGWPDGPGVVLDVDDLDLLEEVPETLRPTRESTTGRGRHMFFALKDGESIGNGTGNLPRGKADVRGCGTGYVLAPPSVHPSGSVYQWTLEAEAPTPMPDWLLQIIKGEREWGAPVAGQYSFDAGTVDTTPRESPSRVERARLWLQKAEPAIQGSGGQSTLFTVASHMAGFGLSLQDAQDLLWSEYNPRCVPPWRGTKEERQFRRHVSEGWSKGPVGHGSKLDAARIPPALPGSGGWDDQYNHRQNTTPAPAGQKDLPPARRAGYPQIFCGVNMKAVREQAQRALLGSRLELYQRATEPTDLVTVNRMPAASIERGISRAKGTPVIAPMPKSKLAEHMAETADWWARDKHGEWVPARPPAWAVKGLHEFGEWTFPPLKRVIEAPTMRPDGTVLDTAGYDPATALLFHCPRGVQFPKVPDTPSRLEAEHALAALLEVIQDFPFERPHHKSVALAGLLTPIVRSAIAGCTPMFLFDATTRGSGKGLLVNALSVMLTGRSAAVMSQVEDEEFEKRLTAMLMAGDPIAVIDDLKRTLGGSSLDAALTTEWWKGRVLGSSTTVRLPMTMVMYATGNNIQLKGDLARRVLRCYLAPDCEHPEERSSFTHHPLLPWVKRNRGRLVSCALTLVRAYMVSGTRVATRPMGSFEAWSRVVREPLLWLGQADPLDSQVEVRALADTTHGPLGDLLAGLASMFGSDAFTVTELVNNLEQGNNGRATAQERQELGNALDALVESRSGRASNRAVGQTLKRHMGRIVAGQRLVHVGKRSKHGVQWRVEHTQLTSVAQAPKADKIHPLQTA